MVVEKKNNRILIVVGAAPCSQDDISVCLLTVPRPLSTVSFMLIGIDAVDKYQGRGDYFATYHPVDILPAIDRRAELGANTDYIVISHKSYFDQSAGRDVVDKIVPFRPPSGSSALLGVLAGISLGYKKIILCGCPLEGKNKKKSSYEVYRRGWTAKLQEIKDVVRSMSGWTRELLGAPTGEWLNE